MNARRPMSVLLAFSIKNIFYDKMDLGLFYFRATKYYIATKSRTQKKTTNFNVPFFNANEDNVIQEMGAGQENSK